MKNQSGPMLDAGLSGLLIDLDQRGMLDETLVIAVGEFGRSPQRGVSTSGNANNDDGRDHWPYCYTAVMAGAGIKRGQVDPETIVYNHLNQPRELVKAKAVSGLFG
jgi:hypothetical protein